MMLTADRIPARTAESYDLLNFVVRHEELLDQAFALARKIVAKSPLAVAACLGSVTRGLNVPIDEALAIEASYFARMVPTADIREGITAWVERRTPQFTGN
jgi:enoyl-CoA hydratase